MKCNDSDVACPLPGFGECVYHVQTKLRVHFAHFLLILAWLLSEFLIVE